MNIQRQWPKDVIHPATARHRMEFWFYEDAKIKLKRLSACLVYRLDAELSVIEWVLRQVKGQVSPTYYAQNELGFRTALEFDIPQMADEFYPIKKVEPIEVLKDQFPHAYVAHCNYLQRDYDETIDSFMAGTR